MKLDHLFYLAKLSIFENIANREVSWSAQIARETHISYSYVSGIVRGFELIGLVARTSEWGKKNIKIEITEEGKKVWEHLRVVKELMKDE